MEKQKLKMSYWGEYLIITQLKT